MAAVSVNFSPDTQTFVNDHPVLTSYVLEFGANYRWGVDGEYASKEDYLAYTTKDIDEGSFSDAANWEHYKLLEAIFNLYLAQGDSSNHAVNVISVC